MITSRALLLAGPAGRTAVGCFPHTIVAALAKAMAFARGLDRKNHGAPHARRGSPPPRIDESF